MKSQNMSRCCGGTDIIFLPKYKTHKLRKYTYIHMYTLFKRSTEFKEIKEGRRYLSSV